MSIKSTPSRYGAVAITLHWVSTLLILALLVTGSRAGGIESSEAKATILSVHIPLGMAILALTLLRLLWWGVIDRKPTPAPMPKWQQRISGLIHALFYVVILGMAASGIGMIVLSGAAPIIFGDSAGSLPNFHDFLPRVPHGFGARAMVALLLFHAGAALYHHFMMKDGLLTRMWFGGH